MLVDYAAQLAEVNRAVTAITERGQRYVFQGRELTRADLGMLLKERARLEPLALRQAGGRGGVRVRRVVPL
ncbi:hypothetical protein M2352_003918 [Azospirillum fermentarium]|uniref:hypothetical protein n=1 Tax=Azospirillum fermentarium TaxID=1233114 RepID=UPI00222767E9|nr:hypothetical protein [Azospirillum fermentarium]MCW2248284.1 hypothetical protein [Azospirillum fermentarium]